MINLGSAVGYLLLDTTSFKDGIKGALSQLNVFKSEGATVTDKLTGTDAPEAKDHAASLSGTDERP